MREAIGAALNSAHLETVEYAETAIDRIGALARATKLGRLLFHWKYAGQAEMRGPVLSELLVKARHRFKLGKYHPEHATLERACKQAMREYYNPQCARCLGARELVANQQSGTKRLRIICPKCGGVGVKRFGDTERIDALSVDRVSYEKTWERRLRDCLGILNASDIGAAINVRQELERDLQIS